jgi:1-acyl-sn-glycerol-3-phosphate acyltransferase
VVAAAAKHKTRSRIRWRLAQSAGRSLLAIGADICVIGAEQVPLQGPLILAGNHLSYVDALLKPSVTPRPDIVLLVWHEIEHKPFFHFFANLIGRAIYIAPTSGAVFAMREAVAWLRAGHVVLLAPEGAVSPTATLTTGQPGVGYLAAATGAPVLPVAMTGQERLFANARRLRRTTVTVEFGHPFVPDSSELSAASIAATTDTIMRRIAAMLPPGYRGIYSDVSPAQPDPRQMMPRTAMNPPP